MVVVAALFDNVIFAQEINAVGNNLLIFGSFIEPRSIDGLLKIV